MSTLRSVSGSPAETIHPVLPPADTGAPDSPRLPDDAAFIPPRGVGATPQAAHVSTASTVLVYAALAAVFTPVVVVVRAFGNAGSLYAAAPLAIAGAAWGIWAWRRQVERTRLDEQAVAAGFTFDRGSTARVRIACRPGWGARLLHGLDPHSGFEPEIARVPLALGVSGSDKLLAALGAIGGVGAAYLLTGSFFAGPLTSLSVWMAMGAAGVGAVALPEFCAPTYVRIVPGRLDVLRFSLFRLRPASLASFDLRRSRVLIDVRRAVVLVEPPGEPRPTRKVRSKRWPYAVAEEPPPGGEAVGLVLTPARRRLLEAACVASVTAAPTPELPHAELLG